MRENIDQVAEDTVVQPVRLPGSRSPAHVPAHPTCPGAPVLGTLDSVAPTALPFCTLHPGAESWLKIESELFRKGLSAQAFVPCLAQWGLDSRCVLQVLF